MRRFWLLAGDNYYPARGAWDFRASFETLKEAQTEGERLLGKSPGHGEEDWVQVLDIETGKVWDKGKDYDAPLDRPGGWPIAVFTEWEEEGLLKEESLP